MLVKTPVVEQVMHQALPRVQRDGSSRELFRADYKARELSSQLEDREGQV